MKPRPIIRYHGGKHKIADWIISFFPEHRCYVEPYGGAASVLIRKRRVYAEVYNDLDGEVVNLFRVVRDRPEEIIRALELTPFSREEFIQSYSPSDDPVEQARRTIARAYMGFGSSAVTKKRHTSNRFENPSTGFRANSNRSGTIPAHNWRNYPVKLPLIIERLQGIVVENRDAIEVMAGHDTPETLHYVDPPYVFDTRDGGSDYRFEMTDEDHRKLADFLSQLKGFSVVSGYRCHLYDELYAGWHREDKAALADGARKRIECLWFSPNFPLNKKLL